MSTTRIGVEIEFWTIDREGNLASVGDLPSACEGAVPEFVDEMLEVKTTPCESIDDLATELSARLGSVIDAAHERDKRLVPLGTPLGEEHPSTSSTPRTEVQRAVLGDDLRHAGHCAGTHVHFEQSNPADQLRVLTALDPAFALLNTTPYCHGERVATCARPYTYRRRCYESYPELGELWRYPESVEEWRERRQDRFEEFVGTAREAGVETETIESAFCPQDAVWSPVRLRDDIGTVEWRSPDAASPRQVLQLVSDIDRVMDRCVEHGTRIEDGAKYDGEAVQLPSFDTVRGLVDSAMERGLSDRRVRAYLERLGFDTREYRPIGTRIDGRKQLERNEVKRIRLQYADRFEREVEMLRKETDVERTDTVTEEAPRTHADQ